jgi:hypothetical protein
LRRCFSSSLHMHLQLCRFIQTLRIAGGSEGAFPGVKEGASPGVKEATVWLQACASTSFGACTWRPHSENLHFSWHPCCRWGLQHAACSMLNEVQCLALPTQSQSHELHQPGAGGIEGMARKMKNTAWSERGHSLAAGMCLHQLWSWHLEASGGHPPFQLASLLPVEPAAGCLQQAE